MRYTPLSSDLYIKNRKKFVRELKPNSLAILNSNDIMPTNADGTMPFRQNNDILYLSGIDQEDTILLIFPDARVSEHREILFIKETSPEIAIWEGNKFTKVEAAKLSGIKNVQWLSEFDRVLRTLVPEAENLYLNTNEHLRSVNKVQTRDDRFNMILRDRYPAHHYERSAPIMHRLRAVKEKEEIGAISKACEITGMGFSRVLEFMKPGVLEYQIEAEWIHEFLNHGSRGSAYTPIIASGYSACVLHYIDNSRVCQAGEVVLMDIGAEYGNYASDLTRCVPVNGKFTARQKKVYNAVLSVMNKAKKILRPGIYMDDYHRQVGMAMEKELVDLRLLKLSDIKKQDPAWPAYKKYFMHGASHFLGLDVHDVGLWSEPVKENMVFTVEPGIYIPDENLGIRLENNIQIKAKGNIDLMSHIPIEAEEIEELMNRGKKEKTLSKVRAA